MNWMDMPRNLFDYEIHTSLNSMYLSICQFIVSMTQGWLFSSRLEDID